MIPFIALLLSPLLLFFVIAVLWRWILRRGEPILRVVLSILRSIEKGLRENEYIGPWIERYPRFVGFLHARVSIATFQGLPLTLLLLAMVYSFIVFSGFAEDYLTNDPLIALDVRLANLFYAFRYERLLHVFYAVTVLANFVTVLAAALLLTVILWWQRRHTYVATLWITFLGSEGMTTMGKLLFHRPRPSGFLPILAEDSYSFPSGHATSAVMFFGFLAYFIMREHRSWNVRASAIFAALMAILLVDVSRLYLGVHYLSDVLAGNILAFGILLFAISVGEWMRSQRVGMPPPFSWKSLLLLPLVAGVSVAAFVVVVPLTPKPIRQSLPTEIVPLDAIPNLFRRGTLPRTTETLIGTPQEPVNLLLIAPDYCLVPALVKAGWKKADVPSVVTMVRIAKAAVFNTAYPAAPIMPSFYDTQPHTLGFEKETGEQSVRSRHHARLWATRFSTASGAFWVGTASLDTNIKWMITHSIAPDIDTERDLFAADLEKAGVVTKTEEFALVPPTLGKNFSGDVFFTEGKTRLFWLKDCGQRSR